MLQLIAKHKTTAVALIAGAFLIGGMVRWMLGQIDATELGAFAGAVGAVASMMIGVFAKDGNLKKKADE